MLDRSHSVSIAELQSPKFQWADEELFPIIHDAESWHVSDDALDALLNRIKVPIKYARRLLADNPRLAEDNINHGFSELAATSVLVEDGKIIQIFDANKLFLPTQHLHELVEDYLDCRVQDSYYEVVDNIFRGYYKITEDISVRVIYSDCFEISPRIDTVYTKDNMIFFYTVRGRKFRVANVMLSQIFDQTKEFISLAVEHLNRDLIPAIFVTGGQAITNVDVVEFVTRLSSDLRLGKKIIPQLTEHLKYVNMSLLEMVDQINKKLELDGLGLEIQKAREIQIALSKYIISGSFR